MFYCDGKLQYTVKVDKPDPVFAKMLQQAVGGIEGELRVALQYYFQAFNARGPKKYRDLLLETATEEMAHVEMLATAVAMNLEGASSAVQEGAAAKDPVMAAILGGMSPRAYLSGGFGAMAADAEGNPFSGSWIVSSGNLAADMYANVAAETTSRVMATRLYHMTDDPGMKDMLQFNLARDTMHQNQWLAVLEELGQPQDEPIPNSFDNDLVKKEFEYAFVSTRVGDDAVPAAGRWSSGPSIDGRGEFTVQKAAPLGQEPVLDPPKPSAYAQKEQMTGGILQKVKDTLGGE